MLEAGASIWSGRDTDGTCTVRAGEERAAGRDRYAEGAGGPAGEARAAEAASTSIATARPSATAISPSSATAISPSGVAAWPSCALPPASCPSSSSSSSSAGAACGVLSRPPPLLSSIASPSMAWISLALRLVRTPCTGCRK